jgi:hypothetical protein
MKKHSLVVAATFALLLVASPARADTVSSVKQAFSKENLKKVFSEENRDLAFAMARRSFHRFRRGNTLGPSVSGAGVLRGDGPVVDGAFGFGLGFLHYDLPLLMSSERFGEILLERAGSELIRRLQAEHIEAPTGAQLKELSKQVLADVRDELLSEMQASHFETPSMAVMLEGERYFREDAWAIRATYGYGVGPVFASGGVGVNFGDGVVTFAHLEASIPILLSNGLNSPVVDVFLRGDVMWYFRDRNADRLQLGARLFFDVL